MSGHRRVKDIAYEDDEDIEDDQGAEYEEDAQGLKPEDQEHMRSGHTSVRRILGSETGITDKEIEEALWYYYFDVEKSVAYLQKQHAPPEPRKAKVKQLSKFEQAAQAAQRKPTNGSLDKPVNVPFLRCSSPLTTAEFFRDTPWLNVPLKRRGDITLESMHLKGGLLGGSPTAVAGKPSKLAALAAARRKAQEEKQHVVEQPLEDFRKPGSPVSLRKQANTEQRFESESRSRGDSMYNKIQASTSRYPLRRQPSSDMTQSKMSDVQSSSSALAASSAVVVTCRSGTSFEPAQPELKASPSLFAQTVLGRPLHSPMEPVTEDDGLLLRLAAHTQPTDMSPFAGPSPDDIVTKAQSQGSKPSKMMSQKDPEKRSELDLASTTASISLDDTAKPKSKNLNVLAEFKKSTTKNAANFVVIGHVDHGKSTLMGRLLYDLKITTTRQLEKLRAEATSIGKSSFALAWVMDSTAEERARGITVDIASNHFETLSTRFTILDAPGHRDFIPNMIAGASQADFAVLVIDASTNAYEAGLRGQTKEHALLIRSMGIARLVIAVNKMDVASWAEARFTEIKQQMTAFLTTAGFLSKNLTFVPCAGLTGENVVNAPSSPSPMPWYAGPTLVAALEASEPSTRALDGPLRLSISDVFRGGVQNPLSISGRLESGSVQVAEPLLIMPSGEKATVKGIEVDDEPKDWAVAGQIATLHLSDIDPAHVRSGDMACDPANQPLRNVKTLTAKVLAFEHVMPGWVDVYRGRMQAAAKIAQLVAVLDKGSGAAEKKKPRIVKPGAVARIKLELEERVPLEAPARIVLRSEGQTIAAGLLEEAV